MTIALFKDGDDEAIASVSNYFGPYEPEYGGIRPINLKFVMKAGTTKMVNFWIRVGMNKGSTEINGGGTNKDLGKTIHSTLTINKRKSIN